VRVRTSRRPSFVLGNLCVWVSWCGRPNLDRDSPLVRGYLRVGVRDKIGQEHDGTRQEPFCRASKYLLISVSALSAVMKIGTFSIPVAM